MTEEVAPLQRRSTAHDAGLVVGVLFAVLLTWAVEWMARAVLTGEAGGHDWFVLSLFAVPLLISLAAIAMSLASRPPWTRWTSAIVILLVPPALLLISGAFHG
jgi:hypothetical protein